MESLTTNISTAEICRKYNLSPNTFYPWKEKFQGAYFDNGKQFIAKEFKAELVKHHIRPIYGKPYNPRGRGKIESYHKVLYREMISQVRFSSLAHFKRELRKFDRRYNYWRKNQTLG